MLPEKYAGAELGGVRYATLVGGGLLAGVDVSHHQDPAEMDFRGLDFVAVRMAYGTRPDVRAAGHVAAAHAHGVPFVGGYSFFRQTQSWAKQLRVFREQLDAMPGLNLAPTVDWEWNTKYDGPVDAALHNDAGPPYMAALEAEYGAAMVYTVPGFWSDVLGAPDWMLDRPAWLSHFNRTPGEPWLPPSAARFMRHWCIHQYQGSPLDRNVARCLPLTRL